MSTPPKKPSGTPPQKPPGTSPGQGTSRNVSPTEADANRPDRNAQFNVVRPVYQQHSINELAAYHFSPKPLFELYFESFARCAFADCCRNLVPILKWLPKYKFKRFFIYDFMAGTTVAILNVPLAMGGALLAEVPPIVGLYMSFFPVMVYSIFGMSQHVAMGISAVACLLAGKVVEEHALEKDSIYTEIEVLTSLCCLVGIFQFFMWCLRLGVVSALLSEPVISAFTTAAAFQAAVSQLDDFFGIKLPIQPTIYRTVITIQEIIEGLDRTNWVSFLMAAVICILLVLNATYLKPWMKRSNFRVLFPAELIIMIVTTQLAKTLKLDENFNVFLVGAIPAGLPVPTIPRTELFQSLLFDGALQAIVTYTDTLAMGIFFASKVHYELDANSELIAMSVCNLFSCFFSCGPVCGSLSRSTVQYVAGGKTMVTAIVSAIWMLVVILWVGPFFEELPRCVIASIMIVALKSLFAQVKDFKKFLKLSILDAGVWAITFLVTLLVRIDIGLGAGLLANLAALFIRSQSPYTCLLGRMKNTDIYLNISRYRAAQQIPGVRIFHYGGGLNFATKALFRSSLYRKIGFMRHHEPRYSNHELTVTASTYELDPDISRTIKCVVIDASALSYVDAPGIKGLVAVQQELYNYNITMLLAGPSAPVLEMVERYNALEKDTLEMLTFPTVHDAVMFYKVVLSKSDPSSSRELRNRSRELYLSDHYN